MSSINSVDSLGTLQWDMLELADHLRQERLFVSAEQQNLQALNEKVLYISSDLAQQAWVTDQQRVNLNRLIVARPDCTPALCCQRANTLENSHFVDAYKHLRYQACLSYGDFLGTLRKSPKLIASCLVEGDKIFPETMQNIIQSLSAGLYGSCLLPEDKLFVLKLLRHLMLLQIIPSDNPRRLLRYGTCAFSRFYSVFHESLFSAKLFLTASLHGPITQLLMEDEMFLDIDPDKASIRFPPAERMKKFGREGTSDFQTKLQRYRIWTVNSLVRIAQRFIVSIRENMHCFPTSVCWLVRQMAGLLTKSGNVEAKEVHAMCTDLVFTYFICPAIVNPEPYGITDAPISYVARFNLMQVGQILQMLSLMKFQQVDSKVSDLYKKFEKDSISSIIDAMLEGTTDDLGDEPSVIDNTKLQGLCRSAAFVTESELNSLITFLQTVNENEKSLSNDSRLDRKKLDELLKQLPSGSVNANKVVNNTPPETPSKRGGILGKVSRGRGSRISSSSSSSVPDGAEDINGGTSGTEDDSVHRMPQDVLVIPFHPTMGESIGLMSEQKVLCMGIQSNIEPSSVTLSLPQDLSNGNNHREASGTDRIETHEKRTRFSLSHDEILFEGSIGNTSDNLEAVSEAASNHSVASSLELETEDQNDNLSDMVSANVSGRGSPNISGRDTPSSQITEGDDVRANGEARTLDLTPTTISAKQSRSEIDDKFCKFEIKKLIEGDETISLVSDTWSTDVLASDCEFMEQQERFSFPPQQPELISSVLQVEPPQGLLDVSETASEAWSTDVLASDSERLTEVDTDDTGSVARSDDTARSEVEVESRGEPEGGVETPEPGNFLIGSIVDGAGTLFRPIREEPIGRPAAPIPPSPTASASSTSSANVTGRGGTRSDYRRSTMEYVDNNGNSVDHDYGKSDGDEGLAQLIDKLQMDGNNGRGCKNSNNMLVNHNSMPDGKCMNGGGGGDRKTDDLDGCSSEDARVRRSTASLTSSSSSGSEPRIKNLTSTPELPISRPITNGDGIESPNTSSAKPSISTGAIPKSISFDSTATRGDKELLDDDQKNKRGFFSKLSLKMSLRNRRGKSPRSADEIGRCYDGVEGAVDVGRHRLRRIMSEDSSSTSNNNNNNNINSDTSEDILAKYRRKPSTMSDTASVESSQSCTKEAEDERLMIDPNNIELSFAFADAKRKLRMVLSTADLQHIPWSVSSERNNWIQRENELVAFLQLQLAEAINLQNRSLIAHLHETLRCVRLFNDDGCRKLFVSLREDYQKRSPYIAYLIRCRQGLLSTLAHLERLGERVKCDRDAINSHLVAVCVRVFLEKRETQVLRFCDEFQKLKVADEKQKFVDTFLGGINGEMEIDTIWQSASDVQLELARMVVERTVMARIYHHALYPNGDGDLNRDQLFHDHIENLSKKITPNHKDLKIPNKYRYECPWPWAQAELALISAYKTPRDKLQCIFRCVTTIVNLLSMASERGIPAADDLMPVLVFVIIKANPPSLLSTVQYVDSFYEGRLKGEEEYRWTQFCSAIEFIKTID